MADDNSDCCDISGGKFSRFYPFVIASVTFLIFAPGITFQPYIVLDDAYYVLMNQHLAMSWENIVYWLKNSCLNLYTPLQMYSYMIDNALFGNVNMAGYHVHSILLHIAAGLLFYYILLELKVFRLIALFAALAFAVNPQRIESVIWISERKDVLCGAFYLLALLLFIRAMKQNRFSAPALILMLLALLAKPMAISLPAAMICYLIHARRRYDLKYILRHIWPYLLLAAGYVICRFNFVTNIYSDVTGAEKDLLRTALCVASNYSQYAAKVFFPYALNPVYPYLVIGPAVIAGIALFALIICAAGALLYYLGNRKTLLYDYLPLIGCFLISLAPVVGFFRVGISPFADRYSYLPSIFLLTAAVIFIQLPLVKANLKLRQIIAAAAVFYLIWLTLSTAFYLGCWKDTRTVLMAACDTANPNHRALINLADYEYSCKNFPQALQLVEAVKEEPWMSSVELNKIRLYKLYLKGMVALDSGNEAIAINMFNAVLSNSRIGDLKNVSPNGPVKLIFITASYYWKNGDKKQAAAIFRRISDVYPEKNAEYYFDHALAAVVEDNMHDAYLNFKKANELSPGDQRILFNLKKAEELLSPVKK